MKQLQKKFLWLYEECLPAKLALTLFSVVVYLVLTLYSGGSFLELLCFYAVAFVYVVLPGFLGVELLRTKRFLPGFSLPLALLIGSGFLAVVYCFAMYLHILPLLYILPPVLGLGFFLGRKLFAMISNKQKPTLSTRFALSPPQWMLVLLFSFLLLVYTFTGVVKNALPSQVGNTLLNHDLLWNAGNAFSFQLAFPPIDIRYFDVRLNYHYFNEMIAGILGLISGVDAYRIVAFYMQPLMLATMVLCLYRLARFLWPNSVVKNLLFPYSLFLFSCASLWKVLPNGLSVFWNQNITHLITNINSQTTAFSILSIFLALFISAARARYCISFSHFALTACSFTLFCITKGPMAAIVAVALMLTILVGLFTKQTNWQGLLLGAVLSAIFIIFYFVLFSSGANSSTSLRFTGTLELGYFSGILNRLYIENQLLWKISIPILYLLQTLLLMPAQVPLFVRGLCHDLRHFSKLSVERMLFYAAGIGGVLAFFIIYHHHMSQSYFLYTGIFFFTLLAVGNLHYLKPIAKTKTTKSHLYRRLFICIVAFFAAAGIITAAFLYTNLLGSGARRLATNLGLVEKYPYDVVMNVDDEAGMEWLRENAPEDSMFATNRIHTGARQEGISNLYSGLSGRQGFMEGFQYAVTNMGVSEASVAERIEANTALFGADTSSEEILRLCQEWDIDYLVYSTQMAGSQSQLAELPVAFSSPTLLIYAVPNIEHESFA